MIDSIIEFFIGMSDLLCGKKEKPEDTSREEFYLKEHKQMNYKYRPKNLDEYIGQENAKELVRLNVQKIMNTKPVHFIISGHKGAGKTTLANIIANMLNFKLFYFIGGTFKLENLIDFLAKNETSPTPNILFIDESHSLPVEVGEFLYPVIEDFYLPSANVNIRPFIFITATTEKSLMLKKFSPLVDRCGADVILEKYRPQDMKEIIKQYAHQVYDEILPDDILDLLSNNVRVTPRIAINLTDDYFACRDINKVLRCHRIIKNSLTDIDIKILSHIIEMNNKPIGEEALSIIAGLDKADYKSWVEPFLITENLLTRTSRGRLVTDKAKLLLQEINNG